MDMEWLRNLIALVEESGVDSLDIEVVGSEPGDPTRVRIRKSPRVSGAAPPAVVAAAPPAAVQGGAPAMAVAEDAATADAAPDGGDDGGGLRDVVSPMVGTFYRAASPGAEPFAKVGDSVEVGQVLCILEAMKLMNELQSEVAGVVREIAVENADPVDFGQLLFRIEPA